MNDIQIAPDDPDTLLVNASKSELRDAVRGLHRAHTETIMELLAARSTIARLRAEREAMREDLEMYLILDGGEPVPQRFIDKARATLVRLETDHETKKGARDESPAT